MMRAPEPPCGLCGVRADVGCNHRRAVGPRPDALGDPAGTKKKRGRTFNAGHKPAPTQSQFDALAAAFANSLKGGR